VIIAKERQDVIVTGDADDLRQLDPSVSIFDLISAKTARILRIGFVTERVFR
jgi:hypothetical protein